MTASTVKGKKQTRYRTFFTTLATPFTPTLTHSHPATSPHFRHLLLPTNDSYTFVSSTSKPYIPSSSPNQNVDEGNLVTSLALSTDATLALVAVRSGHVSIHPLPSEQNQTTTSSRTFQPFHDTRVVSLTAFHPANQHFVIASTDGAVHVHQTDNLSATHVFNTGPLISCVSFHPSGQDTRLFVAKEEGTVLVFDLAKQKSQPIAKFSNHVARVNSLCFLNNSTTLVSAGTDATLVFKSLSKQKDRNAQPKIVSTDEPIVSIVSPMGHDSQLLLSIGEKGTIRLWDTQGREQPERALKLPFVTRAETEGGENNDEEEIDEVAVVDMRESGRDRVVVTLSDQTMLFVSISEEGHLTLEKDVLCGNLEEIYDVKALGVGADCTSPDAQDFAVASNSSCLWVMRFDVKNEGKKGNIVFKEDEIQKKKEESGVTSEENNLGTWSCRTGLQGHTGLLLAVDVLNRKNMNTNSLADAYIASSSRDKTARVWRRNGKTGSWSCIAIAEGHTAAVGAVAISQNLADSQFFIVTGAADKTIKLWKLNRADRAADAHDRPKEKDAGRDAISVINEPQPLTRLSAKWTALAHKKDVNAIAISPDCKIIATGSQDRIMKLWDADKGNMLHSCAGHRRGIWSVCFSRVDKIVATSSGDATVRIWNVANGSCLRTLQGHLAGVLKTLFITSGTQLASCGADGLLKVWATRSGDCLAIEDAHDERAWALDSINDGSAVITGGADGLLRIWSDRTNAKEAEAKEKRDKDALVSQSIDNAARKRIWSVAIRGALDLHHDHKLKKVLDNLIVTEEKPQEVLITVLRKLKDVRHINEEEFWKLMSRLLRLCRDWNCVGGPRSAAVAAHLLQAIFSIWTSDTLCDKLSSEQRSLVEGLEAHCKRHSDRVSQLVRKTSILEYTLSSMKSLGTVDGAEDQKRDREITKVDGKQSDVHTASNSGQFKGLKRRRKSKEMYPALY